MHTKHHRDALIAEDMIKQPGIVTHEYVCPECGHIENDDEVGALNLMFLGAEYLKGDKNPSFTKMEPSGKKRKAKAAKKNAENTIAENAFVLIR